MLGNKFLWKMWHNHCRTNRRVCRHMSALIYWENYAAVSAATSVPWQPATMFTRTGEVHRRTCDIIYHSPPAPNMATQAFRNNTSLPLNIPRRSSSHQTSSYIFIIQRSTLSFPADSRFSSKSSSFFARGHLESGVLLGSVHQRLKCRWSVNAHVLPFVPHSSP